MLHIPSQRMAILPSQARGTPPGGNRIDAAARECTLWIDGFNGVAGHLAQNIDFAIVAAADPPTLRAHARARGWNRPRHVPPAAERVSIGDSISASRPAQRGQTVRATLAQSVPLALSTTGSRATDARFGAIRAPVEAGWSHLHTTAKPLTAPPPTQRLSPASRWIFG